MSDAPERLCIEQTSYGWHLTEKRGGIGIEEYVRADLAQPSQPQAEVTEAQKEAAYEAFYAALLSARPQAEVTEKQISVAVEVYWRESFTKTPTEAMRAALTAALSARQGGK
jgi:hypothetical protein